MSGFAGLLTAAAGRAARASGRGRLGGAGQARERLDELGHVRRVDVRICRLVDGRVREALAELGRIQLRVVVADRNRGEVREEIEDAPLATGVEYPRALRLLEVHDDFVAVRKHVPLENVVNLGRLNVQTAIRDGDGHLFVAQRGE